MHICVVSIIIFFLGMFSPACAQEKNPQARQLYTEHCLSCHSTSITCLHLGRDTTYWNKTVKRMFKKNNQQIETEDLEILVVFLSNAAPGSAPVCK